jgi:LmbE family N-acetylglucosaminyl deacetylase
MNPISRRNLIKRAGVAGGAFLAAVPPQISANEAPVHPARKLKVVVTGGHPGDPECGCGGTIARYTDLGHEVTLLYLNEGEPPGTPPDKHGVRVAEAAKACQILNARPRYAGQIDARAVVDSDHYQSFHDLLLAERPDVVFTHWPIDNHRDHRAVSSLVYDSWLRMRKSFALYYYEVSNGEDTVQFSPTYYVDISRTEARKRAACQAHLSQRPDKFYALQEQITRIRGIESGTVHAEGYIRHIQSPDFALPGGG